MGELLGECLVRGRHSTKVNSLSRLSCPPVPGGPRHSGLQLPPLRRPSQRPPFIPRSQSGPFTRVPQASRARPPPEPRHWSRPQPVRPRNPPTTAPPGCALGLRSFPTAGTLLQLLIGPARQPPLLIGGPIPYGRGRSLSQPVPIGPCCPRVGGDFPAGPPHFLPRPKPLDGPRSR